MLLSDHSMKLNSISDSLFDKNVPFGVEKKVLRRLQTLTKWEYYALIQLHPAPVSNINVSFFSTLVFWQIFLINSKVLYHSYLT